MATSGLGKLPSLPKAGALGGAGRPHKIRKPSVRPTGPKRYKLQAMPENIGGGPGDPPPGFVTGHTSATEWMVYWALCKIKNDPANCHQPPFLGGRDWNYQLDDRTGRVPGGQVLDFAVKQNGQMIGIRVDTERFHIFADAATQAKDAYLRTHLRTVSRVISLWDQDFIGDRSGKAVIAVVQDALRGNQRQNPILSGRAQRIRPAR